MNKSILPFKRPLIFSFKKSNFTQGKVKSSSFSTQQFSESYLENELKSFSNIKFFRIIGLKRFGKVYESIFLIYLFFIQYPYINPVMNDPMNELFTALKCYK